MAFRSVFLFLAVMLYSFLPTSCTKNENLPNPTLTEQTLFIYMPWSSNLTSHFEQNLKDLELVIEKDILKNNRVIVLLASSPTEAAMFELKFEGGSSVRQTIKNYQDHFFTSANAITALLNDVVAIAPANRYAMVISGHGMGWLPISPASAPRSSEKKHWEYEGVALTRYFGGISPKYQVEITTLASGIANAELKMEFILFDDCYMSAIEVAYDLRAVTRYLIASPSEVMAYGFPYHIIGEDLINSNIEGICKGFYDFYTNYVVMPCGTIAATDCSELDRLASIMKIINQQHTFDIALADSVQTMDGYSPPIFFDYGDYVTKLCTNSNLLAQFEDQLNRAIPPQDRMHTPTYYTMSKGQVKINSFSGITISDLSTNALAVAKTETNWYKATH